MSSVDFATLKPPRRRGLLALRAVAFKVNALSQNRSTEPQIYGDKKFLCFQYFPIFEFSLFACFIFIYFFFWLFGCFAVWLWAKVSKANFRIGAAHKLRLSRTMRQLMKLMAQWQGQDGEWQQWAKEWGGGLSKCGRAAGWQKVWPKFCGQQAAWNAVRVDFQYHLAVKIT